MTSVPKSFFFGSLSSSKHSTQSSKNSTQSSVLPAPSTQACKPPKSPRSPRYSSVIISPSPSERHAPTSPPLAEPRARSGSTAEQPRKRSGTFSSTVNHLTSFWEGKNEKKDKDKEKDNNEKYAQEPPALKYPPHPSNPKDIVKQGNEKDSKKHKADKNGGHKDSHKEQKKSHSKEANTAISNEVFEAVKGLNDIRSKNPAVCSPSHPHPPPDVHESKHHHTVLNPVATEEPQKLRDRVKHKARSEGSLIAAIFSRKLDRGGLMQKSSSLIELKPLASIPSTSTTAKSGSAIQIGKRAGYFGVTLQEAMELQKEKYPNASIPIIIAKLTEAILLFEGCKAEGIFRVAGSTQQVLKLQQQFNDLNFDEISSDPHVLVGVLKQWLRELKEPLIPNNIYHECLKCETSADCLRAIEKMPDLNKASLAHLVTFLRQISRPEYLPYTKMDVHNLCLVSAPVMFRCPSTDMAELVVNMQKEKVFLGLVLESPAFR